MSDMAEKRRVSVAMATYNGARFIGAQLASIAAQSVLPRELVVSDDGSTDETLSIIAAFATTSPFPVRVKSNERRMGYAGNFMQTTQRCTGELIAFCDQDDVWHTDKLARIEACFAADADILMVYHNAMLIGESGNAIRPFYAIPPSPASAPALTLQPWHFSNGYSQVFRRELIGAAPLWEGLPDTYHPDRDLGHDLFFFTLAATLGKIVYMHDCLADYRQHEGQAFGTMGCAPPGIMARWLYRLENRRYTYAHLARVAEAYGTVISRWSAMGTLPASLSMNAQSGVEAWMLLAALYRQRERVVGATSALQRWKALRALERQGAYGHGFWTFGSKARLKDAVLGVVLGPLVGRFGRNSSAGDPTVHRGASAAAMSLALILGAAATHATGG